MGTHPIFESDFDCLTEMETNSINDLIDKVKAEVAPNPNAEIIIKKLDSVRLDFDQLATRISPEKLLVVQKYYRELLIFLVKNKKRLDEEVISKSDRIIGDIQQITSHELKESKINSQRNLPEEFQ